MIALHSKLVHRLADDLQLSRISATRNQIPRVATDSVRVGNVKLNSIPRSFEYGKAFRLSLRHASRAQRRPRHAQCTGVLPSEMVPDASCAPNPDAVFRAQRFVFVTCARHHLSKSFHGLPSIRPADPARGPPIRMYWSSSAGPEQFKALNISPAPEAVQKNGSIAPRSIACVPSHTRFIRNRCISTSNHADVLRAPGTLHIPSSFSTASK